MAGAFSGARRSLANAGAFVLVSQRARPRYSLAPAPAEL